MNCIACGVETSADKRDFVCTSCFEAFVEDRCVLCTKGQWDRTVLHTWEEALTAQGFVWNAENVMLCSHCKGNSGRGCKKCDKRGACMGRKE